MIDLKKHIIHIGDPIILALQHLNNVPNNLTLFVLDENETLRGTLTDGDVRRGLIQGIELTETVEKFMTVDFSYLNGEKYNLEDIRLIKQKSVKLLPQLDINGRIIRVIDFNRVETLLPIDAVLMAGGRGERLRPLTDSIPKSLINIGNKPVIEHNIDRLTSFGVQKFFIILGYLGDRIEEYLEDGTKKGISFTYIREEYPLGTIGGVGKIKDFQHEHVLLMNSDLFTNIDFEDFYQVFMEEDADICIATIPYNVDIPYAVLSLNGDSTVNNLKEKPRYTYYANSGIYLLKKSVISRIPAGTKSDATDFITKSIEEKLKIVRYPILGYWIDIGKPEDLQKAKDFAKHLK
jgi:dTDP-glucose pyrophosphorylase